MGSIQSALFNPWDRALYLSVKEKRPFLNRLNFHNPWQGWMQSSVQRMISGGLYFSLQGLIVDALHVDQPMSVYTAFGVGVIAGSLNGEAPTWSKQSLSSFTLRTGMLLNPLAAIKYHLWGLESATTFRGAAWHAWSLGVWHLPSFFCVSHSAAAGGTGYAVPLSVAF